MNYNENIDRLICEQYALEQRMAHEPRNRVLQQMHELNTLRLDELTGFETIFHDMAIDEQEERELAR